MTSQHIPHGRDENAIAPAADPTGKQTEGTSQRKRHEPAIEISEARRTEPSKQDANAPRLTPSPTVSKSGETTGETMTDEMGMR